MLYLHLEVNQTSEKFPHPTVLCHLASFLNQRGFKISFKERIHYEKPISANQLKDGFMMNVHAWTFGLVCTLITSHAFAENCVWPNTRYADPGSAANHSRGKPLEFIATAHYSREDLKAMFPPYFPTPEAGVQIYRLTYQSTSIQNEAVTLSAVVAVPDTCLPSYPSVLHHHGTIFHKNEAPSVSMRDAGLLEASQGFVTLAPDYMGYGASQGHLHPYFIAEAYSRSSIDLIRAMRQVSRDLNKPVFNDLFIKGYSEGGYATLALEKALRDPENSDIEVKAFAPTAGVYNLADTFHRHLVESEGNPIVLTFMLVSYAEYLLPSTKISDMLADPEGWNVGELYRGDYTREDLEKILPWSMEALLVSDFRASILSDANALAHGRPSTLHEFTRRLLANSLHSGWTPQIPTRFFHCIDDDVAPVEEADQAVLALGHQNPMVSYERIPTPDGAEPYTHFTCPAYHRPLEWFRSFLKDRK